MANPSFSLKADFATGSATSPSFVSSADFDRDGYIDLIVTNSGFLVDTASLFLNDGTGTSSSKPITILLRRHHLLLFPSLTSMEIPRLILSLRISV